MKWKLNIIKKITTPIEIEAGDFVDAITKARNYIDEGDLDNGVVNVEIDTTPSASLIRWLDDKKK